MIVSPDPTPEERSAIASIRRTQGVLFAYGAAAAGLAGGIAVAVLWGNTHRLPPYHCHSWSYITLIMLLAFMIAGPFVIGRTSSDRFTTKLLAITAIAALLSAFSVNWWVVDTCSPL